VNVFLDIETIPGQDCYDDFLQAELADFKAPSSLTKTKACEDLGLTGNDAKYTSKDDAIAKWEAKFKDEKAPEVATEKWLKTSFDGAKGQVCSIAWKPEGGDMNSLSMANFSEREILHHFFNKVGIDCGGRPPFFIGQYVAGFDLKFLFHRAVVLGIRPAFQLPFDGRHDRDFFCTQTAWAGYNGRMSQDNLCKAFGFEGKPDDIDGSKVYEFYKAGKIARIEEYNRYDVETVEKIYNRLTFKG